MDSTWRFDILFIILAKGWRLAGLRPASADSRNFCINHFSNLLRFIARILVNITWRPFWFIVRFIITVIRQILQLLINIVMFVIRPFVKIYSYLSYTFLKITIFEV